MQIDFTLERTDIAEAAGVLRQHLLERLSASRGMFPQWALIGGAVTLTVLIGVFFHDLRAGAGMILAMLGGAVSLHLFDCHLKRHMEQHIWAGLCRAGPRRIEIIEWDERLRVELPDIRFSDIDEVFVRDGCLFVFAPCSVIFIPLSALGENDVQSLMDLLQNRGPSASAVPASEDR